MLIADHLILHEVAIMLSQLLARKSIDKLISESEEPEHSLKKSLGPWSLTALGIGAVIGSGIFTVIGTAISGEQFDTASFINTPLGQFTSSPSLRHGRPSRRGPGHRASPWCWWPSSARSLASATPSSPP